MLYQVLTQSDLTTLGDRHAGKESGTTESMEAGFNAMAARGFKFVQYLAPYVESPGYGGNGPIFSQPRYLFLNEN